MATRLVRTRAADRDLFRHVERIRIERPTTARRFLIAVESAYRRLQEMPEIGVARPSMTPGLQGARIWPVPRFGMYLILYRVLDEVVEIVRVVHAAEDITRHLRGSAAA